MAVPRGSIEYSVNDTPYGGDASIPANAFFLALAAISLIACLGFALKTRRYILFSSAMCLACLFEIISYGLRFEPSWVFGAYVLNFGLSTIAPVFVTIAIHFATAPILEVLGREHAVLPPDAHMRLFAWCDATALLIQIVGLGVTFNGAHSTTPWIILLTKSGHTGQSILSIGLLLQTLLLVTALSLLAVAYVRAGKAHREYGYTTFHPGAPGYMPLSPRFRVFLVVIPLAGTCILARCIYRTAAAWDGIGGSLARSQVAWIMAEGLMLTEAFISLAFFHPAIWAQDINKGNLQNSGMGAGGARSQAYDLEGMRDSSYGDKMGKRFSSGTILSLADTMEYNGGDLAASEMVDATPAFSSHLIAASETGSWDGGSPKRQSVVLNANPYYRYEEAGASEVGAAPVAQPPPHLEPRRYSQDITAETRHLSPMELEAEEERRDAGSYITPLRQQQSKKSTMSSEDEWEVGSIVLPPRVPSKRDPTKPRDPREEELEDLAMSSVYSESVGGPSRSATMRTAATDDSWQVPAFELPPRMPSKKVPMLMQQRLQGRGQTDELERSDSVSLYSQP